MYSKSIHVVTSGRIFFFSMAEQYFIVYITIDHSFLIHLSTNRYLGCFEIQAVVNNAAGNTGVQIGLWNHDCMFFRHTLRSDFAGPYSSSVFNFGGNLCFPWWLSQFTIPSTVPEGSLFSTFCQPTFVISFLSFW